MPSIAVDNGKQFSKQLFTSLKDIDQELLILQIHEAVEADTKRNNEAQPNINNSLSNNYRYTSYLL